MFVVCLADGVCDLIEIQVIEADCSLRRLHLGMLLVLWLVFDVSEFHGGEECRNLSLEVATSTLTTCG